MNYFPTNQLFVLLSFSLCIRHLIYHTTWIVSWAECVLQCNLCCFKVESQLTVKIKSCDRIKPENEWINCRNTIRLHRRNKHTWWVVSSGPRNMQVIGFRLFHCRLVFSIISILFVTKYMRSASKHIATNAPFAAKFTVCNKITRYFSRIIIAPWLLPDKSWNKPNNTSAFVRNNVPAEDNNTSN